MQELGVSQVFERGDVQRIDLRELDPFAIFALGCGRQFGHPLNQPGWPRRQSGLHSHVLQDLMGAFVGHRLGLAHGCKLSVFELSFRGLVEEDSVRHNFIIGLDLRIDFTVPSEVFLGSENDSHQWEFGVCHGKPALLKLLDEFLVKAFEQAGAVLGELLGTLIEDQVMIGLFDLEVFVFTLGQAISKAVDRNRLERVLGVDGACKACNPPIRQKHQA